MEIHDFEEALLEARKGGFDLNTTYYEPNVGGNTHINEYMVLCDPKFWISLGKARGWAENPTEIWYNDKKTYQWQVYALRYFETLLTAPEKIKEYWENLP